MRRLAAFASLLLAAACAPAAPPAANASPTPAATVTPTPLPSATPPPAVAAVFAQRGGASQQPQLNHVVAVGLDGRVLAQADFLPPPNINVGPAAVVYPPPVRVAGGRAYFIDGTGHVQQLTAAGPRPVATIPVPAGAEYMLSFGVSADGQHVAATVTRFGQGAGSDVYRADAGGPASLVGHLPPAGGIPASADLVEGFDGDAVVVAVDTYAAVQNDSYPPGHELMGGRLATLSADGRVGNSYGGADCKPYRWFGDRVVCYQEFSNGSLVGVTVRRGDGSVLMAVDRTAPCTVPSADGRRLAARGQLWTAGNPAGAPLPIDACPLAWVDDGHLVAAEGEPAMSNDAGPFLLTVADSTRRQLLDAGLFAGLATAL